MTQSSFITVYGGLVNRLVNDVHVAAPFDEGDERPTAHRIYKALWDTGATNSVISDRVVAECGLIPTGFAQINTAGGLRESPTYFVSVWLPNHTVFNSVKAVQGILNAGFDLLIGMDIIGMGDLSITNFEGQTAFSFRMPSLERVDYTRPDQMIRVTPKQGRNELCHCNSGRKYKDCHGRKRNIPFSARKANKR